MKQKYNNIFTILFTIIIIFLAIYYLYNANKKYGNQRLFEFPTAESSSRFKIYKNLKEYQYKTNKYKYAIENNLPIEEKLNVIVVISNPCLYNRRYKLLKEFEERIFKDEKYVSLYIVELAYGNQKFAVTDKNNPNHLQLRTITPLWHKENMINLGVKYLLPKDYKAFAWIDADIEFENKDWALDTLKILNGTYDVVQLCSHVILLDKDLLPTHLFSCFGYDYVNYKKINNKPGYGWAITREAYEKIGGLYDKAIIGGGDGIMAKSFVNHLYKSYNLFFKVDDKYFNLYKSALIFQEKCYGIRLGHIPGIIKHHFHGTRENRKYSDRNNILEKHNYSIKYLQYDKIGILEPSAHFPEKLKEEIMNYFIERKEDD